MDRSRTIFSISKLFAYPPRAIIPTLADRTAARLSSVRSGIVSPADNLGKPFDSVHLGTRDSLRDDYFVSFSVFLPGNESRRFGGRHLLASSIVVADPNNHVIRNAKVNSENW